LCDHVPTSINQEKKMAKNGKIGQIHLGQKLKEILILYNWEFLEKVGGLEV
jgi:hypothetical protein